MLIYAFLSILEAEEAQDKESEWEDVEWAIVYPA